MIGRKKMIVIHGAYVGSLTIHGRKVPVGIQTSFRPPQIPAAKRAGNLLNRGRDVVIRIVRDDYFQRLFSLRP
jgi:hypothetical protein